MSNDLKKHASGPVTVMAVFTLLLVVALFFRVGYADRDLARQRISKTQAQFAAESAIEYARTKLQHHLNNSLMAQVSSEALIDALDLDAWMPMDGVRDTYFRIISLRNSSDAFNEHMPRIDENMSFEIITEGQSGRHFYSTLATVHVYDLVKNFAVFSSLDEYYYGQPIQPWVEFSGGLEWFAKENDHLIATGKMTRQGVIHDPELLLNTFVQGGAPTFKTPEGSVEFFSNYAGNYRRADDSPSFGPLYSSLPIVVDSHNFNDSIQTALFFYKRGVEQPRVSMGNIMTILNSSKRLQNIQGRTVVSNPEDLFIDRDTAFYCSYIPQWRPDIAFLRKKAMKRGIYIDRFGKGFVDGNPIDVNYHPASYSALSDSYKLPTSVNWQQDEFKDEKIVLGTDMKFGGYNNISSSNLYGRKIVFSERSVFLRGDIGSDLVVVTPGLIFITGPLNVDSHYNLLLLGARGTALSTHDLENFITENQPGYDFINAAREWLINAVIYNPGAGIYSPSTPRRTGREVSLRKIIANQDLIVRISGATIGGNLARWIKNTAPGTLRVDWNADAVSNLPYKPYSVNILNYRTTTQ